MSTTATFGGIAIIGVLAGLWGQIKNIFNYARSFVLVTRVVKPCYSVAMHACIFNLRQMIYVPKLGKRYYAIDTLLSKTGEPTKIVGENIMNGSFIAFYKKVIPLLCKIQAHETYSIEITYIRWTFNFVKFLTKVMADGNVKSHTYARWRLHHRWGSIGLPSSNMQIPESNSPKATAVEASDSDGAAMCSDYIYFYYGYSDLICAADPENVGFFDGTQLQSVSMATRYKTADEQALFDNIKFWLNNRDWYRKRGISWKRGSLVYGGPGTGKSSMVWAVSRALDLPVEIYHLETFTNRDLFNTWESGGNGKIVLIEDIDAVFDGRVNVTSRTRNTLTDMPLTFDAFLNVVDGVNHNDGIFLIITTNFPKKLDIALANVDPNGRVLASRPGRIDLLLHCQPLDEEGVQFIANNILSDWTDQQRKDLLVTLEYPMTAAKAQEICIAAAINDKWTKLAENESVNSTQPTPYVRVQKAFPGLAQREEPPHYAKKQISHVW